ncbi:hypothetical protein D3Y59_17910 (plasmid) [Hymenobacter oligotrophus]|uniref:Uncharacterized protein n=1 Tax=Hymenobacter oligotrophus TaxID=2319843 RepID=A0A3B7RE26_9BACT|nr:hypothetical protein [Hymenobacter oligotrophus]AYA39061.1 hypothetical protein D3Y59_17910 [Hymenobacter oligotrophus]
MLSAYSWSQFGLFMLVVVLLYYLVVGLLYYRAELAPLLSLGKRGGGSTPAPTTAPPALVRPTSAFTPPQPAAAEAAPEAAAEEEGAAENLPPTTEAVVEGQLPASTATATGQDQSADDSAPMDAASASAEEQAAAQDQIRTEAPDQADERLAELVRREAHAEADPAAAADQPTELLDAEPALQQQLPVSYEPLASFEEPVASPLDIITAGPAPQLVAAESVSEYIALLQAGQNPPAPAGLQGSCLAEQMAQHLEEYQAELAALFGADEL